MENKEPHIGPKELLQYFHRAIVDKDRDGAIMYLNLMAEICLAKEKECLDTKFCPDCEQYKALIALTSLES